MAIIDIKTGKRFDRMVQTLAETADYLEALGDALTLMPPEMRDPRDVADEIREMLS